VELEKMRELGRKQNKTSYWMPLVKVRPPKTIFNMAICLIKQNDYLLHRQLKSLGEDYMEKGGMRERMTRMRMERLKY
jgi:four helix bundle suffix protein